MSTEVDQFLEKVKKWPNKLAMLRSILLDCTLQEALKWRVPCFMYNEKNIALIGGFKAYCALSFFKGTLLSDSEGLLHSPGENSQSVKLFKFTSLQEIIESEALIKAYIFEAIELEKSGAKVELKKNENFEYSEELQKAFSQMPEFRTAFEALTPGRQRGYLLFFDGAKQSKTKETIIAKHIGRILTGKGIHDCVCGMSKKMPACDGSHKYL